MKLTWEIIKAIIFIHFLLWLILGDGYAIIIFLACISWFLSIMGA